MLFQRPFSHAFSCACACAAWCKVGAEWSAVFNAPKGETVRTNPLLVLGITILNGNGGSASPPAAFQSLTKRQDIKDLNFVIFFSGLWVVRRE